MNTRLLVLPQRQDTHYAPLAVLGYCLTRADFLAPLRQVNLNMKTVHHAPAEKLQDVVVSILANCTSIKQIDLRIRPDRVLAEAWGREQFAQQATLADTLNAFTARSVNELREATQMLYRQHGHILRHDFGQLLWLDIDPTGLPSSAQAQGGEKGFFSGAKNTYGRQLVRVSAPVYRETLLSLLYPGAQHGTTTFKPSMRAVQNLMELSREQRRHTVLRVDAGLGTDENINWALTHDYQVLAKGYNGKRADALAQRIAKEAWHTLRADRWVAPVSKARRYARRTQTLLLRWQTPKGMKYATLVHSLLDHDWRTIPALYDDRGAAESEIKMDKAGLLLPKRRKKSLAAQEALILLTDIAHNTLAWTHDWMFAESRFATYGPLALVNDIWCMPGEVVLKGGKLQMVALHETHPYAAEMVVCLTKLLAHFGNP